MNNKTIGIIGVGNVVGTLVLLKYTNLGVYAVQLVSSALLTARVFLFAPFYAAYILEVDWKTFFKPLFRGMFTSIVVLISFEFNKRCFIIDSWATLLGVAVLCGVIGYTICYFVVLDKEDRLSVKRMFQKKFGRG